MKFVGFLLLSLFVSLAFATDNYGYNSTESSARIETQGTDAISITVINSFTTEQQALGLDIYSNGLSDYILAVCHDNMHVEIYEIDGSSAGYFNLSLANLGSFGIALNDIPDSEVYVNDWNSSNLFKSEDVGASWTTLTNPAGDMGRGMDFDGTDYWQLNSEGNSIWRFQPNAGAEEIAVPGVSGLLSGLTTFPYQSSLGIALTSYNVHNIYFFEWDGTSLTNLGSAPCPGADIYYSLGLAYNAVTGNMHWSYVNNSWTYTIVEFSLDITSLERSSWGSIKSSF